MHKQFRFRWISVLVGIATVGFSVAHAEEIRIGFVDIQKAIQMVDAGKKARSQLEEEVTKKKASLQKEEASIKKLHEDFQKQASVMSDTARTKKQTEIQEKIVRFQEQTARSQSELQKREQELTEPIVTKLRRVISELAKNKNYTHVLEKNDHNVLYSPEKDDITTDVVQAFNQAK